MSQARIITERNEVHPVDKAYIAGFLDGEGCISLSRIKGRTNWVQQVTFANRDYSVLKWIEELYGGGIYRMKRGNEKWAPAFALTIGRKADIQRILCDLLPFLKIKKLQAENMLAFLSLPPIGKIPLNSGKRGTAFSFNKDDIETKDAFVAVQQLLNKKGAIA